MTSGWGLSAKILASFLVVTVLVFSTISYAVVHLVKDNTYDSERQKASILLESVVPEVGMSLYLGLVSEGAQKAGELVRHDGVLSVGMELASGERVGSFESKKATPDTLRDAIVVTKEVVDTLSGKKLATLRLAYSNDNYMRLIADFENVVVVFMLIAAAIFALNLLFIKYLLSPLSLIAKKMREYTPGTKVYFDLPRSDDEIGTIVSSFQAMQENIDAYSQELVKKDQQLFHQSKLKALSQMISAVAHHWRQPLNALGLCIQDVLIALRYGEIDEEYVKSMERQSMKIIGSMSKTIDDFRHFFATGDMMERFDVLPMINEVYGALEKQLDSFGIEFEIEGEGFEVTGQKDLFKEVLLNIVDNSKDAIAQLAAKDGSYKGHITITIDATKHTIVCKDNGGGLDDEILERIFEPYYTTKDQGQGVGLGLFMSKTVVANMCGSMDIENCENGLCVTITLKHETSG